MHLGSSLKVFYKTSDASIVNRSYGQTSQTIGPQTSQVHCLQVISSLNPKHLLQTLGQLPIRTSSRFNSMELQK